MNKLHRSQFLAEAKKQYPHLRDAINAEEGLLHLEIAVLRRHAQKLIDSGPSEASAELGRCFDLARRYYVAGNAALRNAIDVSFVEDLDFYDSKKTRRKWAWPLLPTELQSLYVDFHHKILKKDIP